MISKRRARTSKSLLLISILIAVITAAMAPRAYAQHPIFDPSLESNKETLNQQRKLYSQSRQLIARRDWRALLKQRQQCFNIFNNIFSQARAKAANDFAI